MNSARGALIVLEGGDRCGKTTQCARLVDSLKQDGRLAELIKFPARETLTGRLADDYLQKKSELEDHAIHLIFTANRWELVPKILKLLHSGVTLIVDRYSYSGVAYSAAKEGMNVDWCKHPEVGLPKPDVILYLTLPVDVAAQRSAFGGERYENTEAQTRVADVYKGFSGAEEWKVINANKSIDALHLELKQIVEEVIEASQFTKVGRLWMDEDSQESTSSLDSGVDVDF